MADRISREQRSRNMSRIRSRDTSPELKMRKGLYRSGLRFRIQFGKEKIDIAFPQYKIAIFIDGCFWHMCPIHSSIPKSSVKYWEEKLVRNLERSREKDARLESEGWRVVHIWEHSIEKDLEKCIIQVLSYVQFQSDGS